ncbi:hypothetical protein GOB57_21215 [Sinorhizobium meliloti]|nr:hypothetical protein [Sinorhizobium meliloti]
MTGDGKYAGEELLSAFGFEPIHDGHWYFCQTVDRNEVRPLKAIVVVELNRDGTYTGHIPFTNDLVSTAGRWGIPDRSFVFKSAFAADMIALAQNEIAVCYRQAGIPMEEGFMDEQRYGSAFISAPFRNNPWGDYGLGLGATRTDKHIRLESPGAVYGRAYHDWRDSFCERVMDDDCHQTGAASAGPTVSIGM